MFTRNPLGLRIIGTLKLASALLLAAAAIGIFHLLGKDIGGSFEQAVRMMRIDPGNHYINMVFSWLSVIDQRHLKEIGAGTFFYALLYSVEGIGLILYRRWAEYLTVVATGLFLPLEVFEIIKKLSLVRVSVFTINIAIVSYLIYLLRRQIIIDHRHHQHQLAHEHEHGHPHRAQDK